MLVAQIQTSEGFHHLAQNTQNRYVCILSPYNCWFKHFYSVIPSTFFSALPLCESNCHIRAVCTSLPPGKHPVANFLSSTRCPQTFPPLSIASTSIHLSSLSSRPSLVDPDPDVHVGVQRISNTVATQNCSERRLSADLQATKTRVSTTPEKWFFSGTGSEK